MDEPAQSGVVIGLAVYASVLTAAVLVALGYLWYRRVRWKNTPVPSPPQTSTIDGSLEQRSLRQAGMRRPDTEQSRPQQGAIEMERQRDNSISSSSSSGGDSVQGLVIQREIPSPTMVQERRSRLMEVGKTQGAGRLGSFGSARSNSVDLGRFQARLLRHNSMSSLQSQEFMDSIEYDSESFRLQPLSRGEEEQFSSHSSSSSSSTSTLSVKELPTISNPFSKEKKEKSSSSSSSSSDEEPRDIVISPPKPQYNNPVVTLPVQRKDSSSSSSSEDEKDGKKKPGFKLPTISNPFSKDKKEMYFSSSSSTSSDEEPRQGEEGEVLLFRLKQQ
eukprot:maker-scaffold649_size119817-snap-gene-0.15 protein:Tk01418 transcript:maker-scaffold649_size119817-snap-gene-0.15-mRNA-1 annotation:"---NA---"